MHPLDWLQRHLLPGLINIPPGRIITSFRILEDWHKPHVGLRSSRYTSEAQLTKAEAIYLNQVIFEEWVSSVGIFQLGEIPTGDLEEDGTRRIKVKVSKKLHH